MHERCYTTIAVIVFTAPHKLEIMNLLKRLKKGFLVLPLTFLLVIFASAAIASTPSPSLTETPAVLLVIFASAATVEWLKFQVPHQQQTHFVEQDTAIWTPVLSSYPGFQSKEIWANPDRPDELVIVTHWASREQWQAIPRDVLDRTTQQFNQAWVANILLNQSGFA